MQPQVIMHPKLVGTTQVYNPWDFSSLLLNGDSVTSATVAATVYSGVDASPSSLINGAATISGNVVSQSITGGVLGVLYELACTALTAQSQTLKLVGCLAVVPDLP